MSKAFTKDDGPTEAPILRRRAPLPAGVPNYVTAGGLQALREELTTLDATTPVGQAATDAQTRLARRAELEQRIASAVVPSPPTDRTEIRFGARVRVATPEGELREVYIVGIDQAAPASHAIAFVAPLARALLGRRAGDVVSVRTPGGDEELTVREVAYDDTGHEG